MTIPALLLAGGAVAGAGMSFAGQQQANATNVRLAREQMAFQERMSNTQYQRAMADMRAAGLNPMLAYMQGGAGNVSGQTAHVENPMSDFGSVVPRIASSALDAVRMKKELELVDAQVKTQKNVGEKAFWDAQQSRAWMQFMADRGVLGEGPLAETVWGRMRLAQLASLNAAAAYARAGVPERMGRGSIFETLRPIFETSAKGMWRLRRLVDPSGRPYGGGQ